MSDTSKLPIKRVDELNDTIEDINTSIDISVSELNDKINELINEINELKQKPRVIETWVDGYSWYRKWNDGYIEQGGTFNGSTGINSSTTKVTFHIPFVSIVMIAGGFTKTSNSATYGQNLFQTGPTTLTTMVCSIPAYNANGSISHAISAGTGYWYACGY